MRIACGLALAISLSVAAAASSGQQDPTGAANTAAQAPTPSEGSPEKPRGAAPAPDQTAPQSDANSNSGSTPEVKAEPASPKSTPVPRSGSSKRRKRTTPPPEDGLRKVVVSRGGTTEPAAQIAPGMTPAEAARQRQNVERLLGATDDQLQLLAAQTLDAKRQETVGQVRNYLEQSRSALKEGDLRRASTLAEKAHLLSDDLVKR